MRRLCLEILMAVAATAVVASAQFLERRAEPPRQWLPPLAGHPSKLSPDHLAADEYPAITHDPSGRIWVAWSSCRPKTKEWPIDNADIKAWLWPDDGEDSVVARWFDGRDWSDEQMVSAVPGVNHKPTIVPDRDGIRVLWTARRNGRWAAYERRWSKGRWSREERIPDSSGTLEVRARTLANGSLLAVFRKLSPPRIELHARVHDSGRWSDAKQLDEGEGRCFRPNLLSLPGGNWVVGWDEERDGNYDVHVRDSSGRHERLTTSTLWDTAPTLARASDGGTWIAWERKTPIGGRLAYQGRSIFGKVQEAGGWRWAPSPFGAAEPGRLTRHSRFWAAHAISEERYPQLLARSNGDLWLLWLGGGRMSSVSFSGRVFSENKWSEPRLIFHDPTPYTAFQLPSVQKGTDLRASGRGPYQVPLANQMALALDDERGNLWMAYEVPRRRHIADRLWNFQITQRPGGFGSDIYSHRVDLDEREMKFARVVEESSAPAAIEPRRYVERETRSLTLDGKELKLAWGDMHGHTENDGIGTVDMYYAQGLFVTGMDFVALSNHDFTPDFLTQSEWAETQALAAVYNKHPNRAALSGWEWTTESQDERGGHRAMYFLGDNGPLYRSTTKTSNTVWKLFSLLRGQDVILQPHHNNWTGYDPDLQPVFEITSSWRQQREEGANFKKQGPVESVWEALDRGYRIGFVGSGDSHWLGTGEDFGITGAYVEELTREGVFDAIRSKRVFASTGARMLIDFRVHDSFMGGQTTASGPVKVEVRVTGDAELDRLEIVKDHRVVHAAAGNGMTKEFEYVDQSPPPADGRASYYYLRVKQKNNMYAWTSPVWVEWQSGRAR